MKDIDDAESFAAALRASRPDLAHADLVVIRTPCIGGTWSLAAAYKRDAPPKPSKGARHDRQAWAAAHYHVKLGDTLKDAVIVHLGHDGKFAGGFLTRCPDWGDR